jgi:hypothetical protein
MQHNGFWNTLEKNDYPFKNNTLHSWHISCVFKLIPTTRIEFAMKTHTKLFFDALSFANAGNLNEFKNLLRQIDVPDNATDQPEQPKTNSQASDNAPVLGHIQGAV